MGGGGGRGLSFGFWRAFLGVLEGLGLGVLSGFRGLFGVQGFRVWGVWGLGI